MALDAPTLALNRPMLVVFGGLPGTGKTTLSRALAERIRATWLRIDVIEQAMRDAGHADPGVAGYAVAQALAEANLRLGRSVVADCVNPVPESRAGWRDAAARAGAALLEVHVLCSDQAEHRRRIATRTPDIPGLVLPDWAAVQRRSFVDWPEAGLVLDTARLSPTEALAALEAAASNSR